MLVDSHSRVPFVGHACEVRVECRSQAAEEIRKWVFEVAVFASAEAVLRHVNVASEVFLLGVEGRDGVTFSAREKLRQDCAAVVIELAYARLPVISGDPCLN